MHGGLWAINIHSLNRTRTHNHNRSMLIMIMSTSMIMILKAKSAPKKLIKKMPISFPLSICKYIYAYHNGGMPHSSG